MGRSARDGTSESKPLLSEKDEPVEEPVEEPEDDLPPPPRVSTV